MQSNFLFFFCALFKHPSCIIYTWRTRIYICISWYRIYRTEYKSSLSSSLYMRFVAKKNSKQSKGREEVGSFRFKYDQSSIIIIIFSLPKKSLFKNNVYKMYIENKKIRYSFCYKKYLLHYLGM